MNVLGMKRGVNYRNSRALGKFACNAEQKLIITDGYKFGHHSHSFLLTANRRHIYLHKPSLGQFPCNDGFQCHRMYVYSNLLSLGALTVKVKKQMIIWIKSSRQGNRTRSTSYLRKNVPFITINTPTGIGMTQKINITVF